MVNVGVEHGSTARRTVYERAVGLAHMGDTWLAKGSRVGPACGARMLALGSHVGFARHVTMRLVRMGCDLGDVRVTLSLSLRARTRCRVR